MRDVLIARWTDVGDKLVALAEEFPEELYDAPPVPGIRSFADQMRHVGFWNQYVHTILRGDAADGKANELPPGTYRTKARILTVLRESIDAVNSELARDARPAEPSELDTMVNFI